MSREPLQTVTLPMLIEEDSEHSDGSFGLYPKRGGETIVNVRVVLPKEIQSKLNKILKPGSKERDLFDGLDELVRAYEGKDEQRLLTAVGKLRPSVPTISGVTFQEDWTGQKVWPGARWEYSSLMSTVLQDAKLIVWWRHKGVRPFSPAIFCPDLKTAAFAMRFAGGLRVCPQCKKPFIPKTENVGYCTPAHGVAYRTARSRRNKAIRVAEGKERGKTKSGVGLRGRGAVDYRPDKKSI